ncbi:hypothetical protein V494_04747 [Pseudogymnoascus sp. VKM F-4513 (FW-928)]|nr:hypothetical protein V494_04747 [Pseudogymnoascus sp. VKM F-4513 (FW-928)]
MNTAPFWASVALTLAVFAGSTAATPTPSSTEAAPSCTASLVAELCDYPAPGPDFAVASSGKEHCWAYCDSHAPCDFVIFVAGNPSLGTGTCWLYPGETYDESKGEAAGNCQRSAFSVFSKPVCAGSPTTSAGACAATASPSAIAEVCDYPTPGDCSSSCSASSSAASCLSQCAQSDSCTYVVFNPMNPGGSPHSSGSCWMYPSGKFDAGSATKCTGAPEQFVYNNVCPKPSPSSTSLSSTASTHNGGSGSGSTGTGSTGTGSTGTDSTGTDSTGTGSTGTGGGTAGSTTSDTADSDDGDAAASTNGGTTGSTNSGTTGSNNGGSTSSNNGGSTGSHNGSGTKSNGTDTTGSTSGNENSAPGGLSLATPLVVGAAVLILAAL